MKQPAPKLTRALNPDSQTIIRLELNAAQIEIVNRLYATGLWGNSATRVVERLLCEAMKGHVKEPEK